MPELPDVEKARRDLDGWLLGAKIAAARCEDGYLLRPGSAPAFARSLTGRTVESVDRRGKWLRLGLDDGGRLFSHLGMTGEWVTLATDVRSQRAERARLDVVRRGRASSVRYLDTRRFGRLVVAKDEIAEWTSLGRDPLADGIEASWLREELTRRGRAVKDILMDQSVMAGIGNILATEALWIARVDPRSPGRALHARDVTGLVRGLRRAIDRELQDHGPRRAEGEGDFFVYGRAGEPCPRDGTRLTSVTIGGRTSVFCPTCQVRRR
jgi:formamidopyrimidine-DNA glycosylase